MFVTLVAKAMMYAPGKFHEIDIKKANRKLKDAIKKVGKRLMLGSADLRAPRKIATFANLCESE